MNKNVNLDGVTWIKGPSWEENCVEVGFATDGSGVGVRDSQNLGGPVLSFTNDEWDVFVTGVKDGSITRPGA